MDVVIPDLVYTVESVFVLCKKITALCLLVLLLYVPGNSYGHGGTVSSPNHTFSWESLNKQLASALCTYFCL